MVVAEDADGDPIRYYINPGTINANNFDVNETTGEVYLERQLDREVCAYAFDLLHALCVVMEMLHCMHAACMQR